MATKKKESSMKTSGVKNPAVITDGCNPELVKGADFDGMFEIPIIKAPKIIAIPKANVPFSKRDKIDMYYSVKDAKEDCSDSESGLKAKVKREYIFL